MFRIRSYPIGVLSFGLLLIAMIEVGCYEYIDSYEEADKSAFYQNGTVTFRNLQSGYNVNLLARSYSCQYGEPSETWQTYHTYKRSFPQICGQSIRRNDDQSTMIDHSISVRSNGDSQRNYEKAWVFFENDVFIIDPLPEADFAETVNLGIQGVLYSDVYVLYPDSTMLNSEIQQLFYHPSYGILRILDRENTLWERIVE